MFSQIQKIQNQVAEVGPAGAGNAKDARQQSTVSLTALESGSTRSTDQLQLGRMPDQVSSATARLCGCEVQESASLCDRQSVRVLTGAGGVTLTACLACHKGLCVLASCLRLSVAWRRHACDDGDVLDRSAARSRDRDIVLRLISH